MSIIGNISGVHNFSLTETPTHIKLMVKHAIMGGGLLSVVYSHPTMMSVREISENPTLSVRARSTLIFSDKLISEEIIFFTDFVGQINFYFETI